MGGMDGIRGNGFPISDIEAPLNFERIQLVRGKTIFCSSKVPNFGKTFQADDNKDFVTIDDVKRNSGGIGLISNQIALLPLRNIDCSIHPFDVESQQRFCGSASSVLGIDSKSFKLHFLRKTPIFIKKSL